MCGDDVCVSDVVVCDCIGGHDDNNGVDGGSGGVVGGVCMDDTWCVVV